jgi:hypothetical protein
VQHDGGNSIESFYRIKLRELGERDASDFGDCLARMRSESRPGGDLSVLKRVGGRIAADAIARCEAAIPELVQAHLRIGNRDAAAIAMSIREHFVEAALGSFPGASLYASLRGGVTVDVGGRKLLESEIVAFNSGKSALLKKIVDYVNVGIANHVPAPNELRRLQLKPELTGWPKVDRQVQEVAQRLTEASTEEQYQAVGLLSREVLISLAQEAFVPQKHAAQDSAIPSPTDAKRMLEAIIAFELGGEASEEARAHAKAAVRLALALQHKRTADFKTAALCAEAALSTVRIVAIISKPA